MIVSVFVVADYSFLDALGSDIKGDVNDSVFTSWCSKDTKFDGVESISGISACHVCEEIECVFIYLGLVVSHSLFLIVDCSEDEFFYLRNLQRFQFEDDGAGDKSRIDFKVWIFCCCADKNDGSVFYKWKEIILLAFVETVNLVDEEDGFLSVHSEILLCFFDNSFHIFFAGYGGVDLGKFSACGVGDYFCQSGFACSRRAVEDN